MMMNSEINFYKRMELVGQHIPYGRVVTYGQIALLCGCPKNPRQVGYALRSGKVGDGFPAHRVVNGKGCLSGAAAFFEPDMQNRMLKEEGIYVKDERVDLRRYQWENSWEEVIGFTKMFEDLAI